MVAFLESDGEEENPRSPSPPFLPVPPRGGSPDPKAFVNAFSSANTFFSPVGKFTLGTISLEGSRRAVNLFFVFWYNLNLYTFCFLFYNFLLL